MKYMWITLITMMALPAFAGEPIAFLISAKSVYALWPDGTAEKLNTEEPGGNIYPVRPGRTLLIETFEKVGQPDRLELSYCGESRGEMACLEAHGAHHKEVKKFLADDGLPDAGRIVNDLKKKYRISEKGKFLVFFSDAGFQPHICPDTDPRFKTETCRVFGR